MDELVRMTACAACDALRRGEVTPADLLDAAEARIAATDGAINALPTLCFDRARAAAKALKPVAAAPPGYLHGLPVAIKDLTDVAGVRTTYGSPLFADHVPAESDPVVERLEAMGALVVAKSNTPEFGAGSNTFNEVFGVTGNPWKTDHTCGGSSGGAASALAAGQVWLAHGSDLGGSLRIPASFCGVVGLRPSIGRVPMGRRGHLWNSLAVEGPMARTVADTALFLDAMVAPVPGAAPLAEPILADPHLRPPPDRPFLDAALDPAPPTRAGFSPDLGIAEVDPEVAAICRAAADRLAALGTHVDAACPDFSGAEDSFVALRGQFRVTAFAALQAEQIATMKPEIRVEMQRGLEQTPLALGHALRVRDELYRSCARFFADHDLLLCPVVVAPPFPHARRYLPYRGRDGYEDYVAWLVMTFAITLTGCPALSLPVGYTAAGLPVGLQMMAPVGGEARLLQAAAALEAELGLAGAVPIDPRG